VRADLPGARLRSAVGCARGARPILTYAWIVRVGLLRSVRSSALSAHGINGEQGPQSIVCST
jgi:hypothetical protein